MIGDTMVRLQADAAARYAAETGDLIERLECAISALGRMVINAAPDQRTRLQGKRDGAKAALAHVRAQEGWVGMFWSLTEAVPTVAPEHREGWALAISYASEGFRAI